jgi:hypothetical protein
MRFFPRGNGPELQEKGLNSAAWAFALAALLWPDGCPSIRVTARADVDGKRQTLRKQGTQSLRVPPGESRGRPGCPSDGEDRSGSIVRWGTHRKPRGP